MGDILIHHNLAGVIEYVGSHFQKISPIKKFLGKKKKPPFLEASS
jgi:hypothetical protein